MYYCTKCRTWHKSGAIARRHRVFAKKTKKKPVRRKAKAPKPIFKVTKKPVRTKRKTVKKAPLRKPKLTISKSRRGQLAMKTTDPHERAMIKRIMNKTGMTYFQVKNLIKLDRHSDTVDIETEVMSVAGESNDPKELYEFAYKRIKKKMRDFGKWEFSTGEIGNMMDRYQDEYERWKIGSR